MRYTARTQHCLEVMGLVPWVRRDATLSSALEAEADSAPALQAGVPESSSPVAQAFTPVANAHSADSLQVTPVVQRESEPVEPASQVPPPATEPLSQRSDVGGPVALTDAVPSALEQLGQWLSDQPVKRLKIHDKLVPATGPETASLLVAVQPSATNDGVSPLHADEAKLFELMMRAIGLTRQHIRVCLLADPRQEGAGDSSTEGDDASTRVASLITPPVRALLLLQQDWATANPSNIATDHQCFCGEPARHLWRIPHPALLLERSALKRQAWHVLQAVHAAL